MTGPDLLGLVARRHGCLGTSLLRFIVKKWVHAYFSDVALTVLRVMLTNLPSGKVF